MTIRKKMFAVILLLCLFSREGLAIVREDNPPAPRIRDNSFLIEEAYNQEAGIIHHIQYFIYSVQKSWGYNFTQEWPVPDEKNQFSYVIPVSHNSPPGSETGIGDVSLNYRRQVILDGKMAFAPRLSVSLPTGDYKKSLGRNSVGIQVNLPYSLDLGESFSTNWNLGGRITPKTEFVNGQRHNTYDFNTGMNVIFFPHTNVNLMVEILYTNVDWVDDTISKFRQQNFIVNPAMRFAINFGDELQIVPGFSFPMIVATNVQRNYSILFYLSFEHILWRPKQKAMEE